MNVNEHNREQLNSPVDGERLRQLSDRLELAVKSAQIGIWDWDIVNDRLVWDDRMYELYGIEPSDFLEIYQAWESRVHPEDRLIAAIAIQQAIEGKKEYDIEFRVAHPDGTIKVIKANAMVNRNSQGEAQRMIGVNYDITEQKDTLFDLKQSQDALQNQLQQQRLVMEMTQRIQQSLNLKDILQTTVNEVRHYLQSDRVIIFKFSLNWNGNVLVESVGAEWKAILSTNIYDPCIGESFVEPFKQGLVTAKSDIHAAELSPCHVELLRNLQVRANLVVPILPKGELWGLLVVHHCASPRQWQPFEIELLQQLAAQVSIAIQQADLLEQSQTELAHRKQAELNLQQLNIELEQRVAERTAELTQVNSRLRETFLDQQYNQIVLNEQAQLLDLAHDTIMTRDLNNSITFWNEGAEFMYGWTKAEALGKDVSTFLGTQFPKPFSDIKAELLEQGYWEGELIHTRRDGSTITVDSRWVVQKDELGRPIKVLQINNDISDRKQAEENLRQEIRHKQLLWNLSQSIRQSSDLNTILDTAVNEVRQVLKADRVAIYRFNPDWSGDFVVESVGSGWVKLVGSDVQKACEDIYLQETAGGRFRNHETFVVADINAMGLHTCHVQLLEQFQAKAYAAIPIFSGELLWGLLLIYQNVSPRNWRSWEIELLTQISNQMAIAIQQAELNKQLQIELQERKQAEAIARESERRWRSLFESTSLAVVSIDTFGIITACNPFFLKLIGYANNEIIGQNWFDLFSPREQTQELLSQFQKNLDQKISPATQTKIFTKAGEQKLINWSNTLLRNLKGEVIGVTSIGEDITERQALEKLKDEFIGVVSHELRTPLTSIRGSLGLLAMGVMDDDPEAKKRMIEIASVDTERLVRLVNDILDLEKLETGKILLVKEWCNIEDLMYTAIKVMESFAQEAEIQIETYPMPGQILASPDRIIQTFTNLLSNAIKFSPSGSIITVRAELIENSIAMDNSITPSSYILFSITDQGRGIPADKLETIFGRFQQVDVSDSRDKGGTGLGLAICQSIVQQHDGDIWAESTLGQGSTFFFRLPIPVSSNLPT